MLQWDLQAKCDLPPNQQGHWHKDENCVGGILVNLFEILEWNKEMLSSLLSSEPFIVSQLSR